MWISSAALEIRRNRQRRRLAKREEELGPVRYGQLAKSADVELSRLRAEAAIPEWVTDLEAENRALTRILKRRAAETENERLKAILGGLEGNPQDVQWEIEEVGIDASTDQVR